MTRLFIHLVKQKQAGVLIGRLWVFLLSLGICLGMVSLFIIVLPGLPHEWHGVHGEITRWDTMGNGNRKSVT